MMPADRDRGVRVGLPVTLRDTRGVVTRLESTDHAWTELLCSRTVRGAVRGLHVHTDTWRLLWVLQGAVADVLLDLDEPYPVTTRLLEADHDAYVLIPPGFAHGFQALDDDVEILLCATAAARGGGIRYDDSDLAIEWPLPPFVAGHDAALPSLRDFTATHAGAGPGDGSTGRNAPVPGPGRRA